MDGDRLDFDSGFQYRYSACSPRSHFSSRVLLAVVPACERSCLLMSMSIEKISPIMMRCTSPPPSRYTHAFRSINCLFSSPLPTCVLYPLRCYAIPPAACCPLSAAPSPGLSTCSNRRLQCHSQPEMTGPDTRDSACRPPRAMHDTYTVTHSNRDVWAVRGGIIVRSPTRRAMHDS